MWLWEDALGKEGIKFTLGYKVNKQINKKKKKTKQINKRPYWPVAQEGVSKYGRLKTPARFSYYNVGLTKEKSHYFYNLVNDGNKISRGKY